MARKPNTTKAERQFQFASWLICVCVCIFIGVAKASDSPFIVNSWSTEQGLPQSSVISVIQTHDGYLWLGTLNGLVRFDGIHFTVFDENNTPGLSSDRIVFLFEGSRTNFWVGTDTGNLILMQNGKSQNFTIAGGGHEGRIVSGCEDSTGGVWFYTANARLARFQNGKMEVMNFNLPSPAICRTITADKSGLIWVGEDWGTFSFLPTNFNPPSLAVNPVFRVQKFDFILASQSGGTWRLADGRVQKWDANHPIKDFGSYPWTNAIATCTCEDQNGNLVVGTLGAGVFWYDANGGCEQISTNQGLSHASVLSLCADQAGNIWAGTDGGGLNRIKRKLFNLPKNLQPWVAQSVASDTKDGLWTTFNASGISYWLTNAVQNFSIGRSSNAWTVLVDSKQRIWAGTRNEGLFQLQADQFVPPSGAEILGPQIFALFEDHDGKIWVGTQNGLANYDGQSWKMFTTRDGLSDNTIRAIAQDTNGDFWIGTEARGLNHFHGGEFISYRTSENGLPGDDISCLLADDENVLWVGTAGHGLARFENGKWTRYSTDDGLASNCINYLFEDVEGNLWIGSNAGLMRIAVKSLNEFADGEANSFFCRVFNEADGLPTRECSSGSQPAVARMTDGNLVFPTTKGLALLNPVELKSNSRPPAIFIESVLVDGREQKTNSLNSIWSELVTVPPGREQLEIDYTALNFSAPNAVRFKYRLEGRDAHWTDAGDTRLARYSNLPPGQYHFHVTAENEDGVWNETGKTLEITVQPQFWQTSSFRVMVVMILGALAVALVRYISTQKLQRQLQSLRQREALEKERSRIARDLHDQLGANLTQVALLGEMAEADKHLPDEIESHAKQISQTARETTRSLDEIVWAVNPANDTLEGLVNYACKYAQEYFALAGLRYRVDASAQLPATPIPPEVRHNAFLAFKESVNNVVKHAQATEAWIRLRLSPENFILEIEDNGRGIPNLDEAQKSSRNGLKNMRKRMEDIRGEFSIAAGANGGTVVRLKIPLIKK
ncbi:MAG TPA: two-component regulator propeller domain-containing protein [Verrucomicrobiae bacterium]|nr:two-component regulator propeller domain-containing protein [Verrucomicrobiae bacterium]